jgi:hypothetical protein
MHTITASGSNLTADYIALAYHNVGGVEISVYADGVFVKSFTPLNGAPLLVPLRDSHHGPITADTWEIEFDTDEQVQIAVLHLGLMLHTARPCQYVGHRPITMARTAEIAPAKSMSGQYLGGRVVMTGARNQLTIENLEPAYVRSTMKPFFDHAITGAYFLAWRLEDYPSEVGYGWTNDIIVPENQRSNGMMSVGWDFEGVADSAITQIGELS